MYFDQHSPVNQMQVSHHYVCTAGRGTEPYVVKELSHSHNIEHTDGKIFFKSSCECHTLLQLKTVERLIILVARKKNYLGLLRNRLRGLKELLDSIENWQEIIGLWGKFQEAQNSCLSNTVDQKSSETKSKQKVQSELKCESPAEKRRKTANTDDICIGNVKCMTQNNEESVADKLGISFRVSCKCSRAVTAMATSEDLSKFVGAYLSRRFGWSINLRQPRLEIYLNLSDEGLLLGIPVTKEPLSKRNYLKHIGLRSTIAFIMVQAADIADGDVVLDPMCGTATILLEAAGKFKNGKYIGCDINHSVLQKAAENIAFANFTQVSLINCNTMYLPFKENSVDKVICDMPFGQNFGRVQILMKDYVPLVQNMNRVLRPGGRCVLLTGEDLKTTLIKTVCSPVQQVDTLDKDRTSCGWIPLAIQYVKLGELNAYMCVFQKVSSETQENSDKTLLL